LHLELYESFTPELKRTWKKFEKLAFSTPFQSYEWLFHWYSFVGEPFLSIKPQVILLWKGKTLLAIFPFGISRSYGIKVLKWLGGYQADYMGPLLSRKWVDVDFKKVKDLMNTTISRYDVMHLEKQKQIIGNIKNPFLSNFPSYKNLDTYKVRLEESWELHSNKKVKKKIRLDSLRQYRRLSKIGKIKFMIAQDSHDKKIIIESMISQKSRRYKEIGAWNMFKIPEYQNLYMGLIDISENQFNLHCSALLVGDKIVATHVGIYNNEVFYYLMPSYESGGWEKYSPGRLLLERLLEWSINNKLKWFDFTCGGEEYKKNWCDIKSELYETFKAKSAFGILYLSIRSKINHLKNLYIYLKILFQKRKGSGKKKKK